MKQKFVALILLLTLSICTLSATGRVETKTSSEPALSILVYITGVIAGSPPYTALAEGATEFASEHENVSVKIYEAGFNQAEWEEQLTALVATRRYDIVLGSNPSLPEICERIGAKFPEQKFILTDAELSGNSQMRTYLYNQYEQSLYLGYLAGLVTTSAMDRANAALKIGFIAAQEYPMLNNHILPGFLAGARLVNPAIEVDFRVVGNWFDANKTAELARSMLNAQVDVFAVIAGGAAQGLFKVVQEEGGYIVFHNTNEYAAAPPYVVGCGSMEQKALVKAALEEVLRGELEYGTSTLVGLQEGSLGFFFTPEYEQALPEIIRQQFESFYFDLAAGKISYTLPPL